MSVLNRIAHFQGRRDEAPNQELARELVASRDTQGIREIAENLTHKEKNVRSDCLKVLYEIGYLAPELIADYTADFLELLSSRDNRMVWGGMIALATVARQRPHEIWAQIDRVVETAQRGTLITTVWGVRALAQLAAVDEEYRRKLFPLLLDFLRRSIPRDVVTHAESMLPAVDESHRRDFVEVLESRQAEMTPAQRTHLRKVLKAVSPQARA